MKFFDQKWQAVDVSRVGIEDISSRTWRVAGYSVTKVPFGGIVTLPLASLVRH
jgi:hypothetical protein